MMPRAQVPTVDLVDLAGQVGSLTFGRGREYFRAGRVVSSSIQYDAVDMRLSGMVRGGRPTPYQCRIWLEGTPGDTRVEADSGLCTCPVGFDCKHIVALALAANARALREQVGTASLPPWRRKLDPLLATLAEADEPDTQTNALAVQFRLVPRPGGPRNPEVCALELRPVQRGRRGWVAHQDLMSSLYRNWLPRDIPSAQAAWFRDLDRLTYWDRMAGWRTLSTQPSGALWRQLETAAELGIQLVGEKTGDEVILCSLVEPVIAVRYQDQNNGPTEGADPNQERGLELSPRPRYRIGRGRLELIEADFLMGALGDLGYMAVTAVPGRPKSWRLYMGPGSGLGARVDQLLKSALPLTIPAAQTQAFFTHTYPGLARHVGTISVDPALELPNPPEAQLVLQIETPNPTEAILKWFWRYGDDGPPLDVEPARDTAVAGSSGDEAHTWRDRPAELATLTAVEAVRAATNAFADPRQGQAEHLQGNRLARFAMRALPLLAAESRVVVEGDLSHVALTEAEPQIRVRATAADRSDWFDLDVTVELGAARVPFADVFQALAQGEEYAVADDGSLISLDNAAFRRLAALIEEASKLSDRVGKPRIGRNQASLWSEIEDTATVEGAESWRESLAQLRALADSGRPPAPEELPQGLVKELRPYQRTGFSWLMFTYRYGLGGVLADDMGLGKTAQTLAMICRAREDMAADAAPAPLPADHPAAVPQPSAAPFLVVAPSSVVPGWLEEAQQFTPGLVVRAATSTRAAAGVSLADLRQGADVIVTTYAIFRLDHGEFGAWDWAGLILDEAQFVKNPATKVAGQARALRTPFKLAITGTPMENSLDELWSVFSIAAPGLLGSRRQFKELYSVPIAAKGPASAEALDQLRRRIAPLLLRRTKEMVMPELPPRQEQVLHVELNPRHRKLYETHLQRERSRMLGLLEDYDSHRFEVLRSLMLLRRAALDITLVDPEATGPVSSKLDVLVDQLGQLAAAGHRALVFSQFTTYLDKVRAVLEAANLPCSYLTGSTTGRAQVISDFKNGTNPVFLISLKAGGFGLNLTEADYVYLLDPWWNPATERQAIDRTHRIGQDRPVMVFRLVAENTIEDKVMALRDRKQALFDALLAEDGQFSTALTAADVRALLV